MKISFVVPLYNGLPLTHAMLSSLRATLPAGLAHEIVLIDDGSTDGTRAWLATLGAPVRVLLNERNSGFAATCNRGAAAAEGEILFFLNNDLELLPGWIEPILEVFAQRPEAGLVGNVQLNFSTGAIDHAGIAFDAKGKPVHLTRDDGHYIRPVAAVTGACFAIRAASWRQLGGFDEGYVNGGEDVDLALRAIDLGHVNYVALRSVVRHHVSASPGRKLRDEHNSARLARRWRHAILSRILPPVARACLAASWEEPRNYADPALVRACLLYLARLGPAPCALHAAAASALDLEEARWAELLDGAPASEPRAIAPALFPIVPEDPPVF